MNNETKTGRGGARPNSGAKPKGIKTKVVRIDAMLFPLVLTLQWELRDGNLSRDDIRELIGRADKTFYDDTLATLQQKISELEVENKLLKFVQQHRSSQSNIDKKLVKRLLQFCHPDRATDDKKAIATELTQALNNLNV